MPDPWALASAAVKVVLYGAVTMSAGLVLIRLMFPNSLTTIDRAVLRAAIGLAIAGIVAALLGFLLRGAALTGDAAGLVDVEMLALMWQTALGPALVTQVVGLALLTLGALIGGSGLWLGSAGAALALWSFTLVGHLSDATIAIRAILVLHLALVAVWVGVLWPLWRLSRDVVDAPHAAMLGARFGRVASALVPVLVLAGGTLAWEIAGSVEALISTAYGNVLILKALLVAVLLLIAARNKLSLVPALAAGDPTGGRKLARSIVLEAMVFLAIFSATSVLTSLVSVPS
ncbi:MAG: CopD family protein [Pseudomonadota bacterium]